MPGVLQRAHLPLTGWGWEGDYLGCYVWGFEESVFAGDSEQGEAAGGTVH